MFNSRCNIFLVNAHVRQCLAFEKLEMENIKLEIQKHLFICGYVFKDSFNRSKLRLTQGFSAGSSMSSVFIKGK